ncbi:hypothetical protein P20652_1036 [Pseudoalteromonas sp. BSi20652]|uniref:hypothetical protein n=1 Tax=Pseudoalteromonas sp. BSi20652 TaxID=388384 RepID=UPI000231702D|nr:hypothetical protein [Pseudoalteromonas sp. BSi20652]GAA59177.1 hypothetical protein P20652_1036 [Pseudoalteromonas sp. BSi20652]
MFSASFFLSTLAIFIAFSNQCFLKMQTTIVVKTDSVIISSLLIIITSMTLLIKTKCQDALKYVH